MARIAHYLRGNKGNSIPQLLIVADAIGLPLRNDPERSTHEECFGAGYFASFRFRSGRAPTRFNCIIPEPADFWQAVAGMMESKKRLWILCYQLSYTMTLLGLWDMLESGLLSLTLDCERCKAGKPQCPEHRWRGYAICGDPPNIIQCRMAGRPGVITIVDARNYYSSPASTLGAAIGARWPGAIEPWSNQGARYAACARRVRILSRWFRDWIDTVKSNRLGNFAETAAKQAWNSWRHVTQVQRVLVHNNQDVLKMERESYYGGRCEVRFSGAVGLGVVLAMPRQRVGMSASGEYLPARVYQVDRNWSYPAAMHKMRVPVSFVEHRQRCSLSDLRGMRKEYVVAIRCTVQSDAPIFPVRHKQGVCFPVGKYTTVLAGREAAYAIDRGLVIGELDALLYRPGTVFTEWVKRLWDLRRSFRANGRHAQERVVKLIGNSLYGKFAQRAATWTESPSDSTKPYAEWWSKAKEAGQIGNRYRSIAWRTYVEGDKREGSESMPIISACITAEARMDLWDAIGVVGPYNWYYCDTDSIHCNGAGLENLKRAGLIDPESLGSWRVVGEYDYASYIAPKHYILNDTEVCSGLPADAESAGNGVHYWRQPDRMRTLIQRGGGSTVHSRVIRGDFSRNGIKGRVRDDGWVEPIRLWE